VAAVGYLATAWLHGTGFGPVTAAAALGPPELAALVPALWLSFSLDLVVLGLIAAVVAWRPSAAGRLVLAVAALTPLGAAGLQMRFLGFIPPTGLLIALGSITLTAATLLTGESRTPLPGRAPTGPAERP
jgi:hypothetical protein